MASVQEIICKCGCGRKKMVRTADIKRGWGKFYSKSCKAKTQERRTGQNRKYINRTWNKEDTLDGVAIQMGHGGLTDADIEYANDSIEEGWDGHKGSF